MQDCRLVMEVKNGCVAITESNVDMVGAAFLCGALEQSVAYRAYKLGKTIEDIKTAMLDIHLGAMDDLSKQIRYEKERRNENEECL